jgi:transcriptional regulator
MDDRMPVMKGTLDLLVLKALSWTPMHGFEVTSWLEERSRGALDFDDSAVYQALYRLEKQGLVGAQWGVTENNRRARYYQIAPAGKEHLAAGADRLVRYAQLVATILAGAPHAV